MGEPGFVFNQTQNNNGATRYYSTGEFNTVHADKNCRHLDGKTVYVYDASMITDNRDVCGDCTVEEPDFKKVPEGYKEALIE